MAGRPVHATISLVTLRRSTRAAVMSSELSIRKQPRRLLPPGWWRWPRRVLLGLLLLLCSLTAFAWSVLKREEQRGQRQLAAVLRETDEKDPRWRWQQIQEDLEPIPDDENSMRV